MEVFPTSGIVRVGGQPVSGATVVLFGATPEVSGPGTVPPQGVTDESGAFRLTSYELDDGAPAGAFKVTVFWPEPTPDNAGEMFQPKDRLKGKYSNPETSGLTAEISEGGGELPPFELK